MKNEVSLRNGVYACRGPTSPVWVTGSEQDEAVTKRERHAGSGVIVST